MLVVSFDEHDPTIDVRPSTPRHKVTGTTAGLEGGARVTLSLNGTEKGQLDNGPFELDATLLEGERYGITVEAPLHACSVTPPNGVVTSAGVKVAVICASADTALTSLAVDSGGAVPLTPAFVPDVLGPYSAIVGPAFSPRAAVHATPRSPSAKLRINGSSAAPGQLTTVPVKPGPNAVDVTVIAASGAEAHYSLLMDASASTYIKASNTHAGDRFGLKVALAGDTLAVGAEYEASQAKGIGGDQNDVSAPYAGAVYVFRRTNGVWAQEAYLKASNTRQGALFGHAVALSGDVLAVGSDHEDSAAKGVDGDQTVFNASSSGAVYVFRRTSGVWAQEAYVKPSNTRSDQYFGSSVALSNDVLAVGAPGESSAATGVDGDQGDTSRASAGAVYLFRRVNGAWGQEAYVKASNTRAGHIFGYAVTLSGDALAVGAHFEDSAAKGIGGDENDASAPKAGAVYVFRRLNGTWAQEAYVKASNTRTKDWFGISVALSADVLAVGASGESSKATGINGDQTDISRPGSGAVYVFRRAGGAWAQEAYVKASNAGGSFGSSLSFAGSGDAFAVGADTERSSARGLNGDQDDQSAIGAGAAYIFRRVNGTWTQSAYVKASNTFAEAWFGSSIAMSGDGLAVGSYGERSGAKGINGDQSDLSAPNAGAVYVY